MWRRKRLCKQRAPPFFDQKVKQVTESSLQFLTKRSNRSRSRHDNFRPKGQMRTVIKNVIKSCSYGEKARWRLAKRQSDAWRKGKVTLGEEAAQSLFNARLWTAATKNQKAPRKKQRNTFFCKISSLLCSTTPPLRLLHWSSLLAIRRVLLLLLLPTLRTQQRCCCSLRITCARCSLHCTLRGSTNSRTRRLPKIRTMCAWPWTRRGAIPWPVSEAHLLEEVGAFDSRGQLWLAAPRDWEPAARRP